MAASASVAHASPLAAELAEDALERFLRYVRIDTQSAYGSQTYPSTSKQLDLSRLLVEELQAAGLQDATLTEHGYVFATLPGAADAPTVALIAHVDTSPDVAGTNVQPQVHRAWDGTAIRLPGDPTQVLDPNESTALAERVGHDIVTTDGTTLLGADDKAGVAAIMAAVSYLARHRETAHAPVRVCFTVDEEIGTGTTHLDLGELGAEVAYTLDGSGRGELEIETFSADQVVITIRGRAFHPGTAKGKLVNAVKLAADLVAALPRDGLSPETTEGREGYVHPRRMEGNADETRLVFIVRDHDDALLAEHVDYLRRLAAEVAEREPRARGDVDVSQTYRNNRPVIEAHPRVIEAAEEAIRRAGVEPRRTSIRGGTDGAMLSARGLPTPNLFTGGQEYHSVREWLSVQDMAAATATIVELLKVWAEPA